MSFKTDTHQPKEGDLSAPNLYFFSKIPMRKRQRIMIDRYCINSKRRPALNPFISVFNPYELPFKAPTEKRK
jgi:hypothetical protein